MALNLGDEFDEESSAGSLELEVGSRTAPNTTEGSTRYGGGDVDFDDDPFEEGTPHDKLELDLPPSGNKRAAASLAPREAAPTPDDEPSLPAGPSFSLMPAAVRSSGAHRVTDPPASPPRPVSVSLPVPSQSSVRPIDEASRAASAPPPGQAPPSTGAVSSSSGASMIANYPPPPQLIRHAPMYAAQVLLRRLELRRDLVSLRRRRSPDVRLYEAALDAYEPATFRLGVAMLIALTLITILVFSLPLIVRGMAAD